MKTRNNIITTMMLLALGVFGLLPRAQAVFPAPDGGYPNRNTAEGTNALFSLTTGVDDTAIGFQALLYNTSGHENTATGSHALYRNTTGWENTATGSDALYRNTTGDENTATGAGALQSNTTGFYNTATGSGALYYNTTGYDNTATGLKALQANTTGRENTAVGAEALWQNTTGRYNTATGSGALSSNTTGRDNTATGVSALVANTTGDYNTAIGAGALVFNTAGTNNTAVGVSALSNNSAYSNTAIGFNALFQNTFGHDNTAIGTNAGDNQTTGSNNVYIGVGINGIAGESNACRIASIFGQTAASGSAVFITSGHKLGTLTSSARFKDEIKAMGKASEAILALKPVTFRYKKEIDPQAIPEFGLIAEEVEKVNPDLIIRDKEGKPYTVRYEQINTMLLNEFLKEHRRVAKLEATVAQQQTSFQSKLAEQTMQIQALASGLQKVSAQVEMSKPATKVVSTHP